MTPQEFFKDKPQRVFLNGKPVVALSEWKEKITAGEDLGKVVLHKQYIAEEVTEVEGVERTLQFTISTGAVDRDHDTIKAEGWETANYKNNPVVLWAHDYRQLPIGKATQIWVEDGKLKSKFEFVPAEINPFADTVYRMVRGGFLNATSVGFAPIDYELDKERKGINFLKQELLEVSICPVPSNPEALIEARDVGIDVEPLAEWARHILEKAHGFRGVWVQEKLVEEVIAKAEAEAKDVPVETKQGRVLSSANESKLRAAVASITEVLNLLESAEPEQMSAEPETADGDDALNITKSEESAEQADEYDIDPATLREAVRAEIRALRTALTGRLD